MPTPVPGEPLAIPEKSPVMILPGCALLPHALLPLYIFEPRYRRMLADALGGNRLFCVAMSRNGSPPAAREEDHVHHHCTIGFIRASVSHHDGTSHLVLQGLRRVRIRSWAGADAPYPVAGVEPIDSVVPNQLQAEALATRLLEIARKLVEGDREIPAQLRNYLATVQDPELIGDVVASHFISDALLRQRLIETADVSQRLRLVIETLGEEK